MSESDQADPPAERPLRVVAISVEGLFGRLNHRVELGGPAHVTIILGPNGVGKTNLLECVAAIFSGKLARLARVPFASLTVEFDDNSAVRVTQLLAHGDEPSQTELPFVRPRRRRKQHRSIDLRFEQMVEGRLEQQFQWSAGAESREWRHRRHIETPPWIERVSASIYVDTRTGKRIAAHDVEYFSVGGPPSEEQPPWFKALRKRVVVHLIETQRLLRTGPKKVRPNDESNAVRLAVNDVAEHIHLGMREARERYTRQAAALDRSYVERFLAFDVSSETLEASLQPNLDSIENRQSRLENLGVLAAESRTRAVMRVTGVTYEKRLALALYVDDMDRKLKVLEPYAEKLEFLLEKINKKLRGKAISASYSDGLYLESAHHDSTDDLDLEQLSSGEQHELVLLHKLIFEVEQNALVLIDEPELSLHPLWQQQLTEDLLQIAERQRFDILIATHSPYIVGHRIDLCRTLSDSPAGDS